MTVLQIPSSHFVSDIGRWLRVFSCIESGGLSLESRYCDRLLRSGFYHGLRRVSRVFSTRSVGMSLAQP